MKDAGFSKADVRDGWGGGVDASGGELEKLTDTLANTWFDSVLSSSTATEKVVSNAEQPEVKTTVSVDQSNQGPPTTAATTSTVLTKATAGNSETVTTSPTQTTTAPSPKEATVPGQSPGPTTTSPPGSADSQSVDDSGRPTNPSGSQGDKMNTGRPPSDADPTSSTEQPVPSGGKSSDNVTTAPPATQGSDQTTTSSSQTPDPLAAAKSPPASTTVSTASPHSPMTIPSQTTEDHSTVVLNNSSGPVFSPPDFSVSPGKTTMHGKSFLGIFAFFHSLLFLFLLLSLLPLFF